MACNAQEDEFDQVDKPGAERFRRRRPANEEWDSDLEDDLLSDDWGLSKKNLSDQSDEELDDNLLQSDEEANESYQGESIDINVSASFPASSLELSQNIGDKSTEEIFHYANQDADDENAALEDVEDAQEEIAGYNQDEYVEEEEGIQYESNDSHLDDQMDYPTEQGEEEMYNDEVLDLEINDPLDDEFQDEEYSQLYVANQDLPGQLQTREGEEYEDPTIADVQENATEKLNEPEEVMKLIQEVEEKKDVSDDEDDDDEESGRIRFKTERKEGTVIRLTDAARKRRNIPDTLELSDEAKAALREFEETERQRKQGKRGRRGRSANFGFCDPRKDGGRRKDQQRLPLMQVPPSLPNPRTAVNSPDHQSGRGNFQQRQQPQPLLVPPRHPSASQLSVCPPQQPEQQHPQQEQQQPQNSESASISLNQTVIPAQQPKNIHINPHFRGPVVSPVQVPLMPTPNQPRPAVGPQRFMNPPEFQPPIPVPANFNQPPRQPLQEPWRGPHPPEREPFFIGEPRFQGQHMFEQRSPPPPLMNNHAMSLQPPMVYTHPGPGFNQQGQHHMFQREASLRASLQPQSHMAMPPFNQPGPLTPRPFIPPRQQFPQAPGQPFPPSPHIQQNLQPPMQLQPLPPHQNSCSPQPIIPNAPHQFRPHLQILPTSVNDKRLQRPQRQNLMKLRHFSSTWISFTSPMNNFGNLSLLEKNIPGIQNMNKLPNQFQASPQRNSNLRELPIAPHNTTVKHHRPMSAPAAQATAASWTKSTASTTTPTRMKQTAQSAPTVQTVSGEWASQKILQQTNKKQKGASHDSTMGETVDEDEETRVYRLKIEEQKKLREEILRQKELRRQQQAGARKKELLERLAQQQQQQSPFAGQHPSHQLENTPQASQNVSPITPSAVNQTQSNIKSRLFTRKQSTVQQQVDRTQQSGNILQVQTEMRKNFNQNKPVRAAPLNQLQFPKLAQSKPIGTSEPKVQSGKMVIPSVKSQELKPGAKRTVMQRMNSGGGDGPHINPKIRILKLPAMQGSENTGFSLPEVQPQRPHQQQLQKQQTVRKVTLTKGGSQQRPQQQRQQSVPLLLGFTKNLAGQQNRVIMQGRSIALPGQMGRGRMMQHKQNLRVVECRPQPCVVSIEGLSSSTTDNQLKNLLMSVGPIQDFKLMREQRKAVAKFKEPAHASAFQQKFHRHMIDLSHINVALIMDE
ncbi:RNA-binding protein 33 isoform X2 [Narcine bancroftii]|uniref:RNA-binding protein 33 isoform X2 n=1 Tax=Narcine bancroftii TaxID=1343680 RepID=UPI0038312231